MYTTSLRKVGGSIMLAVPPAILDLLRLQAGSSVGLVVEGDRLVVESKAKPCYCLDELLAQCDPDAPLTEEDRAWIDLPSVGREI